MTSTFDPERRALLACDDCAVVTAPADGDPGACLVCGATSFTYVRNRRTRGEDPTP